MIRKFDLQTVLFILQMGLICFQQVLIGFQKGFTCFAKGLICLYIYVYLHIVDKIVVDWILVQFYCFQWKLKPLYYF